MQTWKQQQWRCRAPFEVIICCCMRGYRLLLHARLLLVAVCECEVISCCCVRGYYLLLDARILLVAGCEVVTLGLWATSVWTHDPKWNTHSHRAAKATSHSVTARVVDCEKRLKVSACFATMFGNRATLADLNKSATVLISNKFSCRTSEESKNLNKPLGQGSKLRPSTQ